MSRKIFQPNRSGLNSALDQVEEILAKLKERVEANESHHREKETQAQFVDAQTSTTSLCPGYERSRANTRRKNTSVLISRRSSRLSNSSRSLRHKTNAKKNGGQTPEGSLSKHLHGNKIRRKEQPNVSEEDRLSSCTNHSTRHTHRKRSSSFSELQRGSGRGSARDVVDGSRGSSEEILRRVHSQEGTLNNLGNISWIPPLSQSSPREESPSRHKHKPDHLKHTGRPIHKSNKASCSSSKQGLSKEETSRAPPPFKPIVSVSGQTYAEPTLSSKLRTKLTESKGKVEKENVIMTYIPSGHTSKSHHVGVIMQQKLGLLKTVPLKELKTLTEAFNPPEERIKETDRDSLTITENVIRKALNNIRDHIAHAERQPN